MWYYIGLSYKVTMSTRKKASGGFLIAKIKQIQSRVFRRCLLQHGIDQFNGAQGRILFVLWNTRDISISELAKRTVLAKTTLTSMLDRLEKSGHVMRVSDRQDRRKTYIKLTNAARGLKSTYDRVSDQMITKFYAGFSEKEITDFEEHLQRVLDNLIRSEQEL